MWPLAAATGPAGSIANGSHPTRPDHIGVWGASAGGQLVALLGTTGAVKDLEGTGGNLDQSSRVQAGKARLLDRVKRPPIR